MRWFLRQIIEFFGLNIRLNDCDHLLRYSRVLDVYPESEWQDSDVSPELEIRDVTYKVKCECGAVYLKKNQLDFRRKDD